jgi:glycosyltransferase involved in cell wall biosynthesis
MAENLNSSLISVIMPCYNASQFIKESIESVLSQTYENWELIIVDDGSTDSTAEITKMYVDVDNRIQYWYQANGKQGKARNLGISKSKGAYLAFLDADDLWLPEKLAIQIEDILEKKVNLVFADSYFFNDDEVRDVSKKMNVKKELFSGEKSIQLFLEGNRIPILTVLVKKEKVLEVGGFSEVLNIQNAEDYHLWLKLLLSDCVFYSSDAILAKYRVHNNSATSIDRLALDKIPAVFFDLLSLYPNFKTQIEQELKLKFKRIYKTNLFTKLELGVWIKKNTAYLSKPMQTYFYLVLNFLIPTRVTKRLLIRILND